MINKISGWALGFNSKYWGLTYDDGHSSEYGWTDNIDQIKIDRISVDMPNTKTWFTYKNSHYADEMNKGDWVFVEIVKTLEVIK